MSIVIEPEAVPTFPASSVADTETGSSPSWMGRYSPDVGSSLDVSIDHIPVSGSAVVSYVAVPIVTTNSEPGSAVPVTTGAGSFVVCASMVGVSAVRSITTSEFVTSVPTEPSGVVAVASTS